VLFYLFPNASTLDASTPNASTLDAFFILTATGNYFIFRYDFIV